MFGITIALWNGNCDFGVMGSEGFWIISLDFVPQDGKYELNKYTTEHVEPEEMLAH